MEDSYTVIVKLEDTKNCIVKVHRKLLNKLSINIVRITVGGKINIPHYFTAIEHDDKNSEFIYFPQTLGHQLGLDNGSLVQIKLLKARVPDCYCCYLTLIEPKGITLDGHRDELTNHMLDQIRIVYPDLVFPFWTNSNDVLFFKVTAIQPSVDYCILVQDSLINIGDEQNDATNMVSSVADKFKSFLSFFNAPGNLNQPSNQDTGSQPASGYDTIDSPNVNSITCRDLGKLCYRNILNVSIPPNDLETSSLYNVIWVNSQQFELSDDDYAIAVLHKLLPPSEKSKKSEQKRALETATKRADCIEPKEEELFLSTYVLVRGSLKCPYSDVFVCDNLRKQMDISFNCKVFIRRPPFKSYTENGTNYQRISMKSTIFFIPLVVQSTLSPDSARTSLKNYISKHKILILSRGSCFDVSGHNFIISCDPDEPCIPISESILEKMEIRLKNSNFSRLTTSWGKRLPLMKLPESVGTDLSGSTGDQLAVYLPYPFIPWMEQEMNYTLSFIRQNISQESVTSIEVIKTSFSRNVLLLHGPKGSGKTCFLKEVLTKIKQESPSLFVRTIHCGAWKTISSMKKTWSTLVAEVTYSQPSVLVFEDLDLVSPHIARADEIPGSDTIASIRSAYIFSSIIKSFDELNVKFGYKIVIITTCSSEAALNQILVPVRGRTIFSQTISLENPNLEQRKQIIEAFLKHHYHQQQQSQVFSSSPSLNWLDEVAYRCEGYLIADLMNLVDSALLNHVSYNTQENVCLEDFNSVLQDFRPSMMTDVRIEEKTGISFQDIGGLKEVKSLLRSTLLLPLKYPVLFNKCPIRPPRNILLYGAPGTGKSLIAEALANESKVNLIKIRGPELLSKYIGRSEESIRELFERAALAKPCIIFFDEFESLAPRRGQDTTGVTDRVVNQLLAQMDGVEVLEQGVYAIAATSRPDLLDPALLRPGRFDKYICCDFPSSEDRLDIWKVLGRKCQFDKKFNHDIITEITENFTGADIRALLINSQYEAIEDYENRRLAEESSLLCDKNVIYVSEKHVHAARSKTKPCIDSDKRAEYQYIYNRFAGIEAATLPTQQRATLA